MTVTEQKGPKPLACDSSEAITKVGEKANAKQTVSSESKKPAKTEKKQGTGSCIILWHLSFICWSVVGQVLKFFTYANVRTEDIVFGVYITLVKYVIV